MSQQRVMDNRIRRNHFLLHAHNSIGTQDIEKLCIEKLVFLKYMF